MMGLDVGERRIGVAIADELGLVASPLTAVRRGPRDLHDIASLARHHNATRLVVGLPTGLSGREGPQARTVRDFAGELATIMSDDYTIEFWDERLTTTIAERTMRDRGEKTNKHDGRIDAMAAAIILQGFLDAIRSRKLRQGVSDCGLAE